MKRARLAPLLVALVCLGAKSPAAPSLVNVAGSYTGKAASTGGGQSFTAPATLTFTGTSNWLNGTFLYNGILTQGGLAEPWPATHTLKFNSRGKVHGRVTLGTSRGHGSGTVKLTGRTMRVKLKYRVNYNGRTTMTLDGKISFQGKKVTFKANVKSSDPTFDGQLKVSGKR